MIANHRESIKCVKKVIALRYDIIQATQNSLKGHGNREAYQTGRI